MKPWDGIVSEEDQRATYAAGFGRPGGVGKRPALLVIDVQYRTIGTKPMPFWAAIKEFPTSCGEAGWNAMRNIATLLAELRRNDWPVLYPAHRPEEHGREVRRRGDHGGDPQEAAPARQGTGDPQGGLRGLPWARTRHAIAHE